MKSLHIRHLEDEVLLGLKRRAARHRRSLQKEVETVLSDAARMVPMEKALESPLRGLNFVQTRRKASNWSRDTIYDEDGR